MLGYSVTMGYGELAAGESHQVWTPSNPRVGTRGLVMVHGSGSPHEFVDGDVQPSSVKLAGNLASAGIPAIAGDFGNQGWANDTVVLRINQAWALLKAKFPQMRTDKLLLLGVSMGGAGVAHYSQAYPQNVAAVVGIIPLWDLKSFYETYTFAQSEIAGAWGVPTGDPLPDRADIFGNAHLAKGIPHMLGYSSVDNLVLPKWSTRYADIMGATQFITDTVYGHSDAAIGGMPVEAVGRFFVKHGG